ncbi:MAG: NUDIX hydrolase [bacterium]
MKFPQQTDGAMRTPATPLDAATVILVRESARGPYEVLLMRRHRKQDFMGGAYVFPGGRLEEADCDPALAAWAGGVEAAAWKRRLQESEIAEQAALGLFFAALRETFEEAGVLLAYGSSGEILDLRDGDTAGRFAGYRLQLMEGKLSLGELALRENLVYALDLLCPYSHWITPEIEPRRFDTRFFLARHPRGQLPIHDTIEMTRSAWMTPAAALGQSEAGNILLMPPTLKTLDELSRFGTADELFTHAGRKRIDVYLPEAFACDDGYGIRLPYDPDYAIARYKLPERSGEPSRILMKDGRWNMIVKVAGLLSGA